MKSDCAKGQERKPLARAPLDPHHLDCQGENVEKWLRIRNGICPVRVLIRATSSGLQKTILKEPNRINIL